MTDSLVMIDRSIRLSRRNLDVLIMSILLPLMIMILFVNVFGGAISTGTEYVNYVVPGIVLLCTGYGAASTAQSVAHDLTTGMIDRLRSLPIRSSAVLTGHVVASLARNAVSTAVVLLAAIVMGFRPDAGPLEWLAAAGLLLLYVLGMSWLAAGFGALAGSVEAAGVFGFFMLFIPYLSSAFVPTDSMPAFLRVISEHQPITPLTETIRGLLTAAPGGDWLLALAWCVGLLAVGYAFATAAFVRRTRR